MDVDLAISPSTNTLPIRRLHLVPGEEREIDVVYVEFPTLCVRRGRQRYTRLRDVGDQAQYRYTSGSFTVDFVVDDTGLVLDYPGVWRRHIIPTSRDGGGI